MSYDFWVTWRDENDERVSELIGNYTSNARPFYNLLFASPHWDDEVTLVPAFMASDRIKAATDWWASLPSARKEILRRVFFANDWGDTDSAVQHLHSIRYWLQRHMLEHGHSTQLKITC